MDKALPEKLRPRITQKKDAEQREKSLETRGVKERAAEVFTVPSQEALEVQEGIESGKISEVTTEDKAQTPVPAGTRKVYSTDEIEAIRAKLLATLPPQEVMVKQIRKKLKKQEALLTKKMKQLQRRSHQNAFYLTIVIAKLRKIQEYFSLLAHATFELIKHLWLKIVHGV